MMRTNKVVELVEYIDMFIKCSVVRNESSTVIKCRVIEDIGILTCNTDPSSIPSTYLQNKNIQKKISSV